ncbi:hypothetical protein E6O75_ATG08806 [Venturia nashicola]|uniref:Uncharacterized protein n=1 Tax=Venturia nashicola TaxID=86259 RepID=A0A4Z1P0N7_9PEZI|nr:hypothetical protein E6O75_ATG08806 [Venturia nashicola]
MAGKKLGLETSKWAQAKHQSVGAPRPHMNPNLAISLNLGLIPATPEPESVPSLMAAAPPGGSSSPAGQEATTPQASQERREPFMSSVHKAALADEVFQDDTDITVVNPPTPSPVKAKENQLPASALPFTLRSSSLPQPSVADKMAGAKPSSSAAVTQFKSSGRAPSSISERLDEIKRRHLELVKHHDQVGVKNDEKAVQDKAEATRIEAVQSDKEKAVVARIEAERIANENHEAIAKGSELRQKENAAKESEFREIDEAQIAAKEAERLGKEKAQAAVKEAERSGKEKAQAAGKEKEKAYAAAKEAERRAKEAERRAKEEAQAAAKEAERVAKEKERAARVAQEKAEAERVAKEKAAAKLDLQKVIMTTQLQCRTLGTQIDLLKDTHAKSNKKSLEQLQPAQLYAEELKKEQEEISQLMTNAITDVEKAKEVLEQAQAIVENLKDKADSLLYTVVDVNQIISDKEKDLSNGQKEAEAQVTALVLKRDERLKNLEQLVRELAVLESFSRAGDIQKVVGEVEAKAVAEINDQAHGQVEAPVSGNGQFSGNAKLEKPFDESFNADQRTKERQNIETDGKLTSSALPQVAANRGELAVRRVKLTNLPSKATLKSIVPLVWGGNIQEFVYTDGQSWAEVVFVTSEGCKRYSDSTPHGMVFPGSNDRHVGVQACPPEIARENVKEIVEKAMTRCVRVLDVEPDRSKLDLEKFAAGKDNKRAVDVIVRGLSQGRPIVDFRFGSIADAVIFKAELHRSLEWESHPSSFGVDPCATHSGAH